MEQTNSTIWDSDRGRLELERSDALLSRRVDGGHLGELLESLPAHVVCDTGLLRADDHLVVTSGERLAGVSLTMKFNHR
jgi:hypothetical protein